jgi:hypothetical protein
MRYMPEADGVFSLPLLNVSTCQKIVAQARHSIFWQRAHLSTGASSEEMLLDASVRSASVLAPGDAPNLFSVFDRSISRVVQPFFWDNWHIDFRCHMGMQLIRYTSGGQYAPHVDVGCGLNDRTYTILCYLNDDFEGGSTYFPHLNCRVQPKSGRAILFPAEYLHGAEETYSGEKYVFVTWLMSAPSIEWA